MTLSLPADYHPESAAYFIANQTSPCLECGTETHPDDFVLQPEEAMHSVVCVRCVALGEENGEQEIPMCPNHPGILMESCALRSEDCEGFVCAQCMKMECPCHTAGLYAHNLCDGCVQQCDGCEKIIGLFCAAEGANGEFFCQDCDEDEDEDEEDDEPPMCQTHAGLPKEKCNSTNPDDKCEEYVCTLCVGSTCPCPGFATDDEDPHIVCPACTFECETCHVRMTGMCDHWHSTIFQCWDCANDDQNRSRMDTDDKT
jgi:hypothetical protein